jgi:hypothetical protein
MHAERQLRLLRSVPERQESPNLQNATLREIDGEENQGSSSI